jgi:hypothetical protein
LRAGRITFARHRPPLTSQPGADEMVFGQKAFEVFVGGANVNHS